MNRYQRLLGLLTIALTAAAFVQADSAADSPLVPVMMLNSSGEAAAPGSTPVVKEPQPTEIAVCLVRGGQPLPASEACGVDIRLDFYADDKAKEPRGPFAIVGPLRGTSLYRATLPPVDDGAAKFAKITIIRSGDGPREEPLPNVWPMPDGRLIAEVELPAL